MRTQPLADLRRCGCQPAALRCRRRAVAAADSLAFLDSYGIGGPGQAGLGFTARPWQRLTRSPIGAPGGPPPPPPARPAPRPRPAAARLRAPSLARWRRTSRQQSRRRSTTPTARARAAEPAARTVRRCAPTSPRPRSSSRICSPDKDGTAVIEFTVPDSVTAWSVWVHAVTQDLPAGR